MGILKAKMENIDDLLDFINEPSTDTKKGGKGKNKKKNKETKPEETKPEETKTDSKLIEVDNVKTTEVKNESQTVDENEDKDTEGQGGAEGEEKKKKKRKQKKKKKNTDKDGDSDDGINKNKNRENNYRKLFDFSDKEITKSRFQDNESTFRVVKNWEEKPWTQNNWNTLSIDEQFPQEDFPIGQNMDYGQQNLLRSTSAEKKEMDRLLMYD